MQLLFMSPSPINRFVMMQALAVGLGLPENFFDEKFSQPTKSALSLWHYPPHPADTDSWGVGPHTDYGLCTFLLQDDVGGLEVEITERQWIEVKPIPGRVQLYRLSLTGVYLAKRDDNPGNLYHRRGQLVKR